MSLIVQKTIWMLMSHFKIIDSIVYIVNKSIAK